MNELQYVTFKRGEKSRLEKLIKESLGREVYEKKVLTKKKKYTRIELWLLLSILCYIICIAGIWLREIK